MKRKIFNIICSFIILFITILIFIYSSDISQSFSKNILFIVKVLLPSLFPFMIFINFILYSNCIDYLSVIFKPFEKIFKLSKYGITCVVASILGGFPYCAIIVKNFLKENKISKEEAERLLMSMFFPSVSFLFSSLYSLDDKYIYNILSLYISSFLLLYITSFFKKYNFSSSTNKKIIVNNDYTTIYFNVMNDSIKSIFSIIFCVLFFNIIISLINRFISNEYLSYLINGLLEFSSTSINILLKDNKNIFHYIILNIILSFSSFSIIFQSLFYSKDIGFNIKKLLLSRITISLISLLIYFTIYFLNKIFT